MEQVKVVLNDNEIPKQWYNIQADLPTPLKPPLHPGTGKPVGPDDLSPVFPMNLIEQEVSQQRWIDIPEAVLEKYLIWRPTPLYRAFNFEKLLGAPVKIYYKNEGISPAGSISRIPPLPRHIIIRFLVLSGLPPKPGPGNGEARWPWHARCSILNAGCIMVRVSYEQKPYRRMMMNTWGRNASPVRAP